VSFIPDWDSENFRNCVAFTILGIFAVINIVSVKGMGKIEDILVYTKVAILLVISGLFLAVGDSSNLSFSVNGDFSFFSVIIVASITFVAFEGFQLVIHAYNESDDPDKNVPSAIYWAVGVALLIYLVLAMGAISAIPQELLIKDKEYALAAGASNILGGAGKFVIVFGALLATSSAISGTLFGASRLMSVIAEDGYLPKSLSTRRNGQIPVNAIITMSILAFTLILTGGLQTILEFGSITFIIVSVLMALANFKIRKKTKTKGIVALVAIAGLSFGAFCLFYYEFTTEIKNLFYILSIYLVILILSFVYSRLNRKPRSN
jgi:amino acid transporter